MVNNFGYKRIGYFDKECEEHFAYLSDYKYNLYYDLVDNGEIYLFAIYKNEERVGSTLAEIRVIEGVKKLICLETGGGGYDFDKEYLGFYLAIAKVEECESFIVTTFRPAVKKMAKNAGFKEIYSEYEIEV